MVVKRILIVSFFLMAFGLCAASLNAAVLGYDPVNSEQPNTLDSNWVLNGVNPISGFYGGGTIAGTNVSGSVGYWYYDNAGLTDAGYTVELNCLADYDVGSGYYPIVINVYDSGELYQIKIGKEEGVVIQQEGGGIRGQAIVPTGDAYHTYRVVREAQSVTVYMDFDDAPLFTTSLLDNNILPGFDRVLFGDGDGSAQGTAGIDYLTWDNANANHGAPVTAIRGYDPVNGERPDEIPDDPNAWVLAGTSDPIETFYGGGEIAGLSVSGSDKGYWYYPDAGFTSAGYTVDFRALVDSDSGSQTPVQINLYDGDELVQIKLGAQEGIIVQQEGAGIRAQAAVTTNDAYHTYRYVRSGQQFAVFMDEDPCAVFIGSVLDNNAVPGYNRVAFGRLDNSAGGTAGLDYIVWDVSGPKYYFLAEDLNEDTLVNMPDLAVLAANWLECTDPFAPCGNTTGGLFHDTFENNIDPNDTGNWNVWEGPGTDNITVVDGKLVIDGSTSGTWRGWNVVGMASQMSFTNPISDPQNNDVLYMYLWDVAPHNTLFADESRFRGVGMGFGVEGKTMYDGEIVSDDRVLRDRSAYLYFRGDPVGNPSPDTITDGEIWPYGRVARPGYLIDEVSPNVGVNVEDAAYDYRVIMDGSTGGVTVQYKAVGATTWISDGGPIFSGFDDYDANQDGDLNDPEDYLGTERIDDNPVWVNFGGYAPQVDIGEVYVTINEDRTEPLGQCGDENHPYPTGDFNQDCYVNLADFQMLASQWLNCSDPFGTGCN